MRDNEELKRSHANGFGGSDAKMFAKIGMKGIESLSTTEKKRILVALGKMEADDFGGNVYTEAGHLFEDYCAEKAYTFAGFVREKYMEVDGLAKHFKVFAHADFYCDETDAVVECKFSQDETMKVYEDYFAQLQWYYMLGADKVTLYHGWGTVLPSLLPADRQAHFLRVRHDRRCKRYGVSRPAACQTREDGLCPCESDPAQPCGRARIQAIHLRAYEGLYQNTGG